MILPASAAAPGGITHQRSAPSLEKRTAATPEHVQTSLMASNNRPISPGANVEQWLRPGSWSGIKQAIALSCDLGKLMAQRGHQGLQADNG